MKREVPCKTTKSEYCIPVEQMEGMFTVPSNMPRWEPMYSEITLRDGSRKQLLIRSIREEEVDELARFVQRYTTEERDFYDIVAARVYAELLAIKRRRMKDQYFFLGLADREPVGLVNGRVRDEKINMSLHTMVFQRKINAGPILFYAKCWYAFEICGNSEFWITFESYNGWMLAGLKMGLPTYPWPQVQHELGGAKVYLLDRWYWETSIRDEYPQQIAHAELLPNPPEELIKANETIRFPEKAT
jgi:hypothetical protein